MTKDTTQERWNQGYYKQLEGATILRFKGTDFDEFGGNRGFPMFVARLVTGELVELVLSQDEEGNGGGFMFGLPDFTLPEFLIPPDLTLRK
jgi:hypothetical protein